MYSLRGSVLSATVCQTSVRLISNYNTLLYPSHPPIPLYAPLYPHLPLGFEHRRATRSSSGKFGRNNPQNEIKFLLKFNVHFPKPKHVVVATAAVVAVVINMPVRHSDCSCNNRRNRLRRNVQGQRGRGAAAGEERGRLVSVQVRQVRSCGPLWLFA